jgi:hypothetical protein
MTLVVTFGGRTPLPSSGGSNGSDYLWTYRVEAAGPSGLVVGQRLALALPGDAPVRDPDTLYGISALLGMFVQRDPAASRVYVGCVVSGPGEQTISFVAPAAEGQREVLLVSRDSGQPWSAAAFATGPGGLVDVAQVMTAPAAPTVPASNSGGPLPTGRPIADFTGTLPYASEQFGVYQPLIGWRSALSHQRLADAAANRFNRAAALVTDGVAVDGPALTGPIAAPRIVDRTGTVVGRLLAGHAAGNPSPSSTGSAPAHDWGPSLAATPDSPLSSITRIVTGSALQAGPPADPGVTSRFYTMPAGAGQAPSGDQAIKEAATATLLHYLGHASPDTVSQMFTATVEPWRRVLAAADFFSAGTSTRSAFLSPIGILHLFREYFFELGTFLGPPVGHVWISPGGTVELVEVNTRRTLVQRTVEQSTETIQRTELSTTDQDELSDAVKVENANDTKLGVTASGSGGVTGIFQASASGSFNLDSSRKQAQEQTHKQMRQQSAKLSSEVRQNYKTTFRTETETTDTSSRRYVLQNTTGKLVSYELSRKMRKVGVQVQDLGQQLCWQLFVDKPGDPLGIGEFVHATSAALDPGVKVPDKQPYPDNKSVTFSQAVPFVLYQGADDDGEDTYVTSSDNADHGIFKPDVGKDDIIQFTFPFKCPPPPAGFSLSQVSGVDFHGAQVKFTVDPVTPGADTFTIRLSYAYFAGRPSMPFDATLVYEPTAAAKQAVDAANATAKAAYNDEVALKKEQLFYDTLRTRLKLIGQVAPRPQDDLREEERNIVYRAIVSRLYGNESGWTNDDFHVAAELIRYLFDVDSMLYFVAPDWWRPRHQTLASKDSQGELQPTIIAEAAVSDRVLRIGKSAPITVPGHRPYYLITEETAPAPQGASLGWLIQLDGDAHRNAFLNSPWVKAVLPIRPGRERDAMAWLQRPEVVGTDGLTEPYPYDPAQDPPEYQGLSIQDVLLRIADKIALEYQASLTPVPVAPAAANSQLALPTETVFTHGFDPLAGGIKFGANAFEVFSQWTEILPTDQVVATEYDLTGL